MTDREKFVELFTKMFGKTYHPSVIEGFADFLISNGATVQNWIPVTEKVPLGDCLAINDCGACMVGKIVKDPFCTLTGYACMLNDDIGIGDITHWMSAPKAPKEE